MRFSKVRIPEEITSHQGLKEINLTKKPFPSTVALIGRNGAGKTRILKLIEHYLSNLTEQQLVEEYLTNIPPNLINGIVGAGAAPIDYFDTLSEIKHIQSGRPIQGQRDNPKRNTTLTPFLEKIKKFGQAYIKIVNNDELNNIKDKSDVVFNHLLKNSHFDEYFNNHKADDLTKRDNIIKRVNEFSSFNSLDTVDYFQQIANEIAVLEVELMLKNRENPAKVNELLKESPANNLFVKFQKYIKHFLGSDFTYETNFKDGVVTSSLYEGKKKFDIKLLSPGQKTLFAYAILLFFLDVNKKTNIKDSIIIIDEPEKHLHPEAQIALINALKDIVAESGQLWIATHSVHILSHLEYDEIFLVKDGKITHPTNTTPGDSLNELMGIDEHIEELSTFITSTSEWAYANFMRQCFKSPEVVFSNNPEDPQFKLFKQFINEQKKICLLDYGAGKGRIGITIKEDNELKNIDYFALEPNIEFHNELEKIGDIDIFPTTSLIRDEGFDCVLLCNVLHEISPQDWIENLNEIKRVLKPKGYLLIIEDKILPKGEVAHECGYIILGYEELNILFNTKNILQLKSENKRYKDRVLFCAVSKEQIIVNDTSLIKALELLNISSFEELKNLRKPPFDISQGRRYANQSQLYINSQIALEELRKTKNTMKNN